MADTRITLQLQANNAQMNNALKATNKELEVTTEAMKASGKQAGITAQQYYVYKEGVEQVLDGLRLIPGELSKLGVHLAEETAHLLEWAEAAVRSSVALAEIPKDMESIKGHLQEGKHAIEEYMEALHNDEFLIAAEHAEQLETRMEGLTGSAEAAAESMEYLYSVAGKAGAGFSSESFAEAGLTLKELHQDLEETIPLAQKLAQGSGEGLERSANTLGNAFNGLNSGLNALQRTYHITQDEIKQFNPALDENGKIAQRTTAEIEQTRKAITAAINSKYGDTMAKSATTVGAAFQRIENLLHHFTETIGSYYSKSVTEFVNGVGDMIEKANEFLPVLKYMVDGLYNFLTPISLGMKAVVAFGNAVLDAGIKVKKTFEELPGPIKDTVVMLSSGAAVAIKVTSALSGMLAASAVFGILFKGVGLLTGGLAGVLPASGLAARGLMGVSDAANASAGLCMRLIGVVLAFPVAAIAVGVLAGAFMVYRNQVKYAEEETKKYNKTLDEAIESGERYKDVIGKSSEEILKGAHNSGQLQLALDGVRAQAERTRVEYEKLAQAIKEKDEAYAMGQGGPVSDDERLELAKKEKAMKLTREAMKKANVEIRKALAERRAAEEKDGSSGDALMKKSEQLEERNLKFQKDKAAGKIQTKRQEADEMRAIYDQSVKDRENLEKDIEVLEARKKQNPEDKAIEARLEKFKAMYERMSEMEHGYQFDVLAIQREAVREDLDMQTSALDAQIGVGKAGNTEKIAMLKDFMAKNAEALKNDGELQKRVQREITQLVFAQSQARKQAALEVRTAERGALDAKLEDLKYEDSIGKNRLQNLVKEGEIIHKQIAGQIQDIKDKLAIQNEAEGDDELRAANAKKAEAEIQALLHQEKTLLRENQQAHAEMTAQEIADNIARIESAKSLLQSKLEAAEARFEHGYDNQDEIRANKAAQLQKEVDIIRSEEKQALATEKNAQKILDIKTDAENKIKVLRDKFALESANFEEQLQIRLAQRKVELSQVALAEQENRRAEFEAKIRASNEKGLNVYQEEQRYIQQNLDLRIAAIRLEAQAELAHNQAPAEKAKIQRKYAAEEKKARLDAAKEERSASAKEETARAEALKREVEDQGEILDQKIRMGTAGKNTAEQEKQAALDKLAAEKKVIEARAKEQIASGDIKDKARIQRDMQLQINKAVRDCGQALKDVNQKYATGNTALDKLVAKYDRALQDLQRMQGILDQWDDEPAPEPPTKEEMENDPMAKSRWEDAVRDQKRKVEKLKKQKEEAQQKKEREDQMKADEAVEADTVKKRREELKGEGKSSEEIREILAQESTARRKAAREAEKNGGKKTDSTAPGTDKSDEELAKLPPSLREEMGLPDNSSPQGQARARLRKKEEEAANGSGTGGSEMLQVMKMVAQNTAIIAQKVGGTPSSSAKNGGQGPLANSKQKKLNGEANSDFSLGDKMGMTPYSFPGMG